MGTVATADAAASPSSPPAPPPPMSPPSAGSAGVGGGKQKKVALIITNGKAESESPMEADAELREQQIHAATAGEPSSTFALDPLFFFFHLLTVSRKIKISELQQQHSYYYYYDDDHDDHVHGRGGGGGDGGDDGSEDNADDEWDADDVLNRVSAQAMYDHALSANLPFHRWDAFISEHVNAAFVEHAFVGRRRRRSGSGGGGGAAAAVAATQIIADDGGENDRDDGDDGGVSFSPCCGARGEQEHALAEARRLLDAGTITREEYTHILRVAKRPDAERRAAAAAITVATHSRQQQQQQQQAGEGGRAMAGGGGRRPRDWKRRLSASSSILRRAMGGFSRTRTQPKP